MSKDVRRKAPQEATKRSPGFELPPVLPAVLDSMRWVVVVLLLLLCWLQYRLWVGEGSLAELSALRGEIVSQESEIERLRARNRTLEAEVEDLRSGQDALEERARSELGMIKDGEIFLQVIEQPGSGSPADEP